jgi:glycine oxidase
VNITVVGAGVVGSAVAYELASRGANVHIVDARGAGQGATRASAGILAPATEGHSPELLRLARSSLAVYDDFIRRVHVDSGIDVEYDRSGTLQVAFDAAHATTLRENARMLEATGAPYTVLDAHEARRFEPAVSSRVVCGLLVPTQGFVRVPQLVSALLQAAINRGAVLSAFPALRVAGGNHHASVVTATDTIESDAVILATGAWAVDPMGITLPAPVTPIRGQLLQLQLSERIASRVIWGSDCYLVPWRDGSVLVGATVEDVGFDERSTVSGVSGLLRAAVDLVPAMADAEFREVRVGLRPKTADELPAIGRSSTMHGVFHATGHYRNGVLLAPLTAALIGDLVLDGRERDELALVRPDRFGL